MREPSQSTASKARSYPVVIAGGGLAGIACAIELTHRGVPTLVLESRQRLGGRATSHVDPATSELIDNCQHVTLGCCYRYINLCHMLGVGRKFAWTTDQTWIEPGGRRSRIGPVSLPAPAHYGPSFAFAKFLSTKSKAAIAVAMGAISLTTLKSWRGRTFAEFLAYTRQPEEAIERFWQPVIVSACNFDAMRVDASLAIKVFRDGFLASRSAGNIGVPKVPLANLYDNAASLLSRASGEIRTGASVAKIHENHVELASGEVIKAQVVVCALPPERAYSTVDSAAQDERFTFYERLCHSPILGVHLWFDRLVLDTPHAVLVGKGIETQWLFQKHESRETPSKQYRGQCLHAVISGADSWMDLTEDAIIAQVRLDIAACLGESAAAALIRGKAIKERRATFAATPNFEQVRPDAAGSGPIILAGDYTNTGWPATMEGSVRSGESAANAVIAVLSRLASPGGMAPR